MVEKKQTAFIEAYQSCHDAFLRYCSALAYSKMDMEDLVQDVLLSAYVHFEHIKKKDQLLHYLIRAARNKAISIWRKRKHQTELLDKHTNQLLAQGILPDTILDIQLMYRALDQLPEKQRNALILFEISGFSMKEIAQIQNSSEGAIKTKISRGRKKLRGLMKERAVSLTLLGLLGATTTNAATTNALFTNIGTKAATGWKFSSFFQNQPFPLPTGIGIGFNVNTIIMSSFSIAFLTIGLLIFLPKEETEAITTFSSFQQQPTTITKTTEAKPIISTASTPTIPKTPKVVKTKLMEELPTIQPIKPISPIPVMDQIEKEQEISITEEPITTEQPVRLSSTPSFPAQHSKIPSIEKEKTIEPQNGCKERVKFRGDAKSFKKDLLTFMKKDGLITSKKPKHTLSFDGNKVLLNKKAIPKGLQGKYLTIFGMHNILPCPNRIIETTSKYIAVGDITPSGFQGSMYGEVDLDVLNSYSKDLE